MQFPEKLLLNKGEFEEDAPKNCEIRLIFVLCEHRPFFQFNRKNNCKVQKSSKVGPYL